MSVMQEDALSPGRTRRRGRRSSRLTTTERAELVELRREVRKLRMGGEIRANHADSGMAVAAQVRRSRATAV